MSIFISNLAFEDSGPLAAAKFAVLVGSLLAAAASLILARLQPAPVPVRAQTYGPALAGTPAS
jgi:Na+/H+ antiporter NhaA